MAVQALQLQCTLHKVLNGIGPGHPDWNRLDQQSYDLAQSQETADAIEGYKNRLVSEVSANDKP